jgi:hypothetical protein
MGTRLQRFAAEEEAKRALEKAQHGYIVAARRRGSAFVLGVSVAEADPSARGVRAVDGRRVPRQGPLRLGGPRRHPAYVHQKRRFGSIGGIIRPGSDARCVPCDEPGVKPVRPYSVIDLSSLHCNMSHKTSGHDSDGPRQAR